jgi:hypothetical protein
MGFGTSVLPYNFAPGGTFKRSASIRRREHMDSNGAANS